MNRLYCLRSLYVAYYATGKTEYLDSFCQYLWGWIESNEVPDYEISLTGGTWQPYRQSYTAPHGPWRALEVGIRVSNMLDAYHAIYQQKRITLEMKWHFFRSLMEHALYIQNYLKRCANGNWESTVASGFASLCIMTPEWKCTEKLLDYSVKTINNNLKLAFNQDGFQFETTTGYHKHVVAGYIRTEYLFHVLNGTTCLDETNRETLKKSIDIVALMKKPNGNDPVIGDCAFEYDGEKESIIKDDFFIGASLLSPNICYERYCNFISPESVLVYGIPVETESETKTDQQMPFSSIYLPASQLAIMRSSSGDEGNLYLLFDNAIDGAGSHQHHDFLNIEMFAYDHTLIIDPGRGSSYNHPLFTSYYRTVKGHNVIQVGEDSKRQERKQQKGSVENLRWITNDNYDFACGIMKDYEGVDIIRNVFFVKGEYWFLWDQAVGNEDKKLTQRFHLPPGNVDLNANTKVINTYDPYCANISLVPFFGENDKIYLDNGYVFNGKFNIWAPIVTIEKNTNFSDPMAIALYPRKEGRLPQNFKTTVRKGEVNTDYILDFGDGRKDIFTTPSVPSVMKGVIVYTRMENGAVTHQFTID